MISDYISYHEGTYSTTAVLEGIDNTPNLETLERMRYVAKNIFDKVRKELGALRANSFYRCPALNKAVRGAANSQHTLGEAIDIIGLNGVKNSQIFNHIKEHLEFDQLIAEEIVNGEPSWVHVSCVNGNNRNEILVAIKTGEKQWRYEPYKPGAVNI